VVLQICPFPATKRAQRYPRAWGEPRKKVLKTSMGKFSFVQNEHGEVGDNVVFSASLNGCRQGKVGSRGRSAPLFLRWEVEAVWTLERLRGLANTGLDTISGYSKQCGGRRFSGVAQTMRRARSVGDLPLVIACAGRDEPLRGEEWAGGNVRASSNEVCAGLPGLGGNVRRRNDAGGIAANPGEAKEIDCYA
jgi:hypothetical protein